MARNMDFENILSDINYYDEIDYYDDILWPLRFRLPKVYIRDASNPFELPRENFKKRFRFVQESVLYIVSLIRNSFVKYNNRGITENEKQNNGHALNSAAILFQVSFLLRRDAPSVSLFSTIALYFF